MAELLTVLYGVLDQSSVVGKFYRESLGGDAMRAEITVYSICLKMFEEISKPNIS